MSADVRWLVLLTYLYCIADWFVLLTVFLSCGTFCWFAMVEPNVLCGKVRFKTTDASKEEEISSDTFLIKSLSVSFDELSPTEQSCLNRPGPLIQSMWQADMCFFE